MKAITSEGQLLVGGAEARSIEVHLDTGAEINVIDQSFAVEKDLPRIQDAALPRPTWMDGNNVFCYGAYPLEIRMTDSWGQEAVVKTIAYAIDKQGPPVTLGMPGLASAGIKLDPKERRWRFGIVKGAFQVDKPHVFAAALENETAVYALVVSGTLPAGRTNVGSVHSNATRSSGVTGPSLPKELSGFKDVFSTEEAGKLPSHVGHDHAIETTAEPPYGPLYNLSNTELAALRAYLDEALAKGWIRHSTSPAGSPILFVPKKDGGLRLCVDYRGLNKVTVKNRHPLPLISETLDRLCGAKLFTKLDLKDAYHRIRIKSGDEWKTAFRTRYGHFEYMVMPFGLTNAPATFQAYINKSLSGIIDEFCVVYLDDILIFSRTEDEHLAHVKRVLERLRKFRLFVSLKKCEFFTTEVEFLGFVVSTTGVTMDKSRVDTIMSWPKPKSFHDVQVFLGFVNFFRRFIQRYSMKSAPLSGLLKGSVKGKKSGPFEWPSSAERAFNDLREAFLTVPIMRHFDPHLRIRVETDASDYGLAGILSQLYADGQWRPVAFWSRKMGDAERNYETHDQELLAIVMAFKQWRHYLEGRGTNRPQKPQRFYGNQGFER